MTNNIKIILICVLTVSVGALTYVAYKFTKPEPVTNNTLTTLPKEQVSNAKSISEQVLATAQTTGTQYKIAEDGKIFYEINKVFLSKPVQKVVGNYKTSDVKNQSITYNEETNLLNAQFNLDVSKFSTDSSKRDSDVLGMMTSDQIKVKVENISVPSVKDLDKVVATIEFNNQQKAAEFAVNATQNENNVINIKGSTKVKLSDFNFKAPNLANVYSVEDDIVLNFDLNLLTISQ